MPAGHESPSGAFKPQTGLRGKVSATFEAREAAGCGSLRLLRALRGTRILQAAAPTAPPCFGRRPRSSPLQHLHSREPAPDEDKSGVLQLVEWREEAPYG